MGRRDNRKSLKMRRRKSRAKFKKRHAFTGTEKTAKPKKAAKKAAKKTAKKPAKSA